VTSVRTAPTRRRESGWPTVPGRAGRRWASLSACLVGAVAVAVGLAVVAVGLPGRDAPFVLAAGPVLLAVVFLAHRFGPRWCLAGVVATTIIGWYTVSRSVGRVNLRVTDIPLVALIVWAVVIRVRQGPRRVEIGQAALAALMGVFLVSLLPVLATNPHEFASNFVSWARLAATFGLVWLVPYAVDRPADRRFIMKVVVVSCSVDLAWAILQAGIHGHLGNRLATRQEGADTLGLIGVILAVTVLYGAVPLRRWLRLPLFALALLAIGLSHSVGSIVAAGLIFGLAPLPRSFNRHRWSGLLLPLRVLLLAVAVIGIVAALRPENLPGAKTFSSGTTQARLIYGTDGLEQFSRNPVLGVGFQRSQLPQNVADPAIVADLHRRFPGAERAVFPDPQACNNPSPGATCDIGSVHNTYIQVAAETGAVGLAVLLLTVWTVGRRIRVARRTVAGTEFEATLRWALLILIVVLIWWNDNPLFGAQPETVYAALALGVMATPWLSTRTRSGSDAELVADHRMR
jgi:O-antigen ligase